MLADRRAGGERGTLKPAGSEAGEVTMVVYAIAPRSSSVPFTAATVEAFCPMAT
jgi:hypothetical protein